jgi:hypothetical protein
MKKKLPPVNDEFEALLQLDKIEPNHLVILNPQQQIEFRELLSEKLAATTGEERDAFIQKIIAIIEPDKIWYNNHERITKAIQEYIRAYSAMPSKVALAQATGLSRQTIHKHLRNLTIAPELTHYTDMFTLMTPHVITKILEKALSGDMNAAKLYMQAANKETGSITPDVVINHQNNYIQINGTVLSQQAIQQLKPELLQQLEEIITKAGIKSLPSKK